jgi:hypothetical protein
MTEEGKRLFVRIIIFQDIFEGSSGVNIEGAGWINNAF